MVIVAKKFDKTKNLNIFKIHADLTGEKINELSTTVFYDKKKFIGYVVLIDRPTYVKLDWLYCIQSNYEKKIMEKLEKELIEQNIYIIKLDIYLDPDEKKDIMLRRMNFYIDLHYNIYDIKFQNREIFLYMKKELEKN